MKLKVLVLSVVLAFSLTACSKQRRDAMAFKKFYKQETGQKLKITKLNTLKDGVTVFKNKSTGELVAYNVSKFNKKSMHSMTDYLNVANQPGDVVHNLKERRESRSYQVWHDGYYYTQREAVYDDYGNRIGYTNRRVYQPGYYTTETTTTYFYEGDGFTFAENSAQSKDLDSIAAAIEESNTQELADAMVSQYGLSEERAESLANLAVNYSELSDSRKLTDADKEVFAKQALGVSYQELEKEFKNVAQGADQSKYQSLIEKASKLNGTTAATTSALISTFFTEENNQDSEE